MSNFNPSPQERQRLISMYITQYNQTNMHITRLFNTLDDIRNNINTLIGNNVNNMHNMHNMNRTNRSNHSNRQNRQHNFNASRGAAVGAELQDSIPRSFIHYDYNNPIERSTYIAEFMNDIITNNTANIHRHDNNPHIADFLTTFLNSVPVRPTQEQINNASRLVRFDSIQTPNSTACAISLEPFGSEDNVRQLHHCGHIFFPDQFNQWFSNNVRCPVCRHDIRSSISPTTIPTTTSSPSPSPITTESTPTTHSPSTTTTTSTNYNPLSNIIDQLTIDISNNELSDNLISTIASRFLTNLLNPSVITSPNSTTNARSNNDRIVYDPATDAIIFETIIRSNNDQS
jgi:hypothetical protein